MRDGGPLRSQLSILYWRSDRSTADFIKPRLIPSALSSEPRIFLKRPTHIQDATEDDGAGYVPCVTAIATLLRVARRPTSQSTQRKSLTVRRTSSPSLTELKSLFDILHQFLRFI